MIPQSCKHNVNVWFRSVTMWGAERCAGRGWFGAPGGLPGPDSRLPAHHRARTMRRVNEDGSIRDRASTALREARKARDVEAVAGLLEH